MAIQKLQKRLLKCKNWKKGENFVEAADINAENKLAKKLKIDTCIYQYDLIRGEIGLITANVKTAKIFYNLHYKGSENVT